MAKIAVIDAGVLVRRHCQVRIVPTSEVSAAAADTKVSLVRIKQGT